MRSRSSTVGASSCRFFPMSTKSMKPFVGEFLFPLIAPLLTSFGIATIGWPGVGKTPLLIILALAIGRYHINRLELEGVSPGWRRAKAMDNFRHRNAQIHEGLILDDPNMDKMEPADVKSWLTSEEDQSCSRRYTDVKLVADGLRALVANDFVPEDEPLPDKHHTSIDPKVLQARQEIRKFFDGYKEADMMAVLKRCILFIFGKRATYLRLPSQVCNALIHCIRVDDLHEDLFTARDKDFYAKYKVGIHAPPPTFEADVAKEQELMLQGIESMQTAGRPETYLADINQKIANELGSLTRTSTAVHLPASPSTDEETASFPRSSACGLRQSSWANRPVPISSSKASPHQQDFHDARVFDLDGGPKTRIILLKIYDALHVQIPRIIQAELDDNSLCLESCQTHGRVLKTLRGIRDGETIMTCPSAFFTIWAADMVLVKSRLSDVVTALHLSSAIFRRIQLNFLFSLGYNCLGIPLAAGLFFAITGRPLAPFVSGFAMALSSVSVVSSSLMLRRYRPPAFTQRPGSASFCQRLAEKIGVRPRTEIMDEREAQRSGMRALMLQGMMESCGALTGANCSCNPCDCRRCLQNSLSQ
ncbi:HMA5, partial [Symbiodinium sp. KB8]